MNIFLTMILAMFNILGWAYNPFLIKTLLKKISPLGFTILRGLLTLPIALIGTIFVRKEIFNKSEQFYKVYGGSACGENTTNNSFVEGMMETVPFRGHVKYLLKNIREGLQSAFSYTGSSNLSEFKKNCEFVAITGGGIMESKI